MRRAFLFVLLCVPATAKAQVPPMIPGARIRVEAGQARIEGMLMSQTADSLMIGSVDAIQTSVPLASVSRIKVNEGKSHGAGAIRGIKIGGAVGCGLALLSAVGYAVTANPDGQDHSPEFLTLGLVYAVSGALLGAAIGGAGGAEKWTTVYSSPTRLSFGHTRNGAPTVGLAIRF